MKGKTLTRKMIEAGAIDAIVARDALRCGSCPMRSAPPRCGRH